MTEERQWRPVQFRLSRGQRPSVLTYAADIYEVSNDGLIRKSDASILNRYLSPSMTLTYGLNVGGRRLCFTAKNIWGTTWGVEPDVCHAWAVWARKTSRRLNQSEGEELRKRKRIEWKLVSKDRKRRIDKGALGRYSVSDPWKKNMLDPSSTARNIINPHLGF